MHTWGGGSINWEEGAQSTPQLPSHSQLRGAIVKGGGGKGGGMVGRGHPHNTTGTHSKEEGRSNTPTCQCKSTAQPLFKCTSKKKSLSCKKETDTLPHLRPNRQVSPRTHTVKCEGGG